jgi:hypothetical protein
MPRPHVDVSGGDLGVGPGHEVVDLRGGPAVDELGQRVGEPGVRVHAVELAGLDQRGDDRPVGAALVAAGEECVLPIERDRPDAALDRVGVDLDAAVVEEAAQGHPSGSSRSGSPRPSSSCVAALRVARQATFSMSQSRGFVRSCARRGARRRVGRGCRLRWHRARQSCRARRSRSARCRPWRVVELAAEVAPAVSKDNGATWTRCVGEVVVPGIAVDLQHAVEAGEQRAGVPGAATGRVAVGNRWRIGPAPRSVVARDGPEISGLRLAATGIEHRTARFVAEQLRRSLQQRDQSRVQRLEFGGSEPRPSGTASSDR